MKSEDAMKFVGYGLIISIGVVLIIIGISVLTDIPNRIILEENLTLTPIEGVLTDSTPALTPIATPTLTVTKVEGHSSYEVIYIPPAEYITYIFVDVKGNTISKIETIGHNFDVGILLAKLYSYKEMYLYKHIDRKYYDESKRKFYKQELIAFIKPEVNDGD